MATSWHSQPGIHASTQKHWLDFLENYHWPTTVHFTGTIIWKFITLICVNYPVMDHSGLWPLYYCSTLSWRFYLYINLLCQNKSLQKMKIWDCFLPGVDNLVLLMHWIYFTCLTNSLPTAFAVNFSAAFCCVATISALFLKLFCFTLVKKIKINF